MTKLRNTFQDHDELTADFGSAVGSWKQPCSAVEPRRPVVTGVAPQVDCGRHPGKATVGRELVVKAQSFCDGHDLVACELVFQRDLESGWATTRMEALPDDWWRGSFTPQVLGLHRFIVRARIDEYATWLRDLNRKVEAGQVGPTDLAVGAGLVERAATKCTGETKPRLEAVASTLRNAPRGLETLVPGTEGNLNEFLSEPTFGASVLGHAEPDEWVYSPPLSVNVDPERAAWGSWYELFPRSASPDPGRPGTLRDVRNRLPYVARLGFDVLYLPPIHPIGVKNRKGADGAVVAGADDPGSPWAIGSAAGGHCAIDPALGTIDDFEALVARAAVELDIDVALDLAFQCSPDHPWVSEHPEWFHHRPDGSIQYAENPPKRYEDIYPFDFASSAWRELWQALLGIVEFWISRGVKVFRVDNPHTKPFAFWEWLISSVKADHPEVVFLAEAFTRPAVMYQLAKVGFSQSYTYFAWRTSKWEIESYLNELVHSEVAEFFRPNLWPNTPDILAPPLRDGKTGAFSSRLVLAATLSASYGIYGPAFELQERAGRDKTTEEYASSEKYAIRHWDLEREDSLAEFVARLNAIRRGNRALQANETLRFHGCDNDQVIVYSKTHGLGHDGSLRPEAVPAANVIVVVVNLDSRHRQSGWVWLDRAALGLPPRGPFEVRDLLTSAHYSWDGDRNFVALDPEAVPAHIFELRHPSLSTA